MARYKKVGVYFLKKELTQMEILCRETGLKRSEWLRHCHRSTLKALMAPEPVSPQIAIESTPLKNNVSPSTPNNVAPEWAKSYTKTRASPGLVVRFFGWLRGN